MTYKEACAYLDELNAFGIKPGLERIQALMDRLGHPEKAYKTIHVTGTNGKGSVSSFIHEVLRTSQLHCGIYTSPHLKEYTERIRVGQSDISREDFAALVTNIKEIIENMVNEGGERPTQFEVITAMAFQYFKEREVDYAVIEVGLGGTLDSTNIILPEVSIITNVSIDHQSYCGNTVDEIARHKAGIIKNGVPVVTAAQGSPLKVIGQVAHARKCRLYTFDKDFAVATRHTMKDGQMVTIDWREKQYDPVMLVSPLRGPHQAVNMACATMALRLLMDKDSRITEDALRIGISTTFWPGRFEVVSYRNRTFIFDGAHNQGGAEAFAVAYKESYEDKPKTIVVALLADKDVTSIIPLLVQEKDYVITVPAPTPRTIHPKDLIKMMPCQGEAATSITEGMTRAVEITKDGDIILVCGSLYILGEARSYVSH